ncbi:Hypothetical protein, putative [Bodo saltans]|uniref:Uncharacterized protein n=1 Tax=Bodo saltans TaxID=75058 RepID=A0A0S4IND7_BODSA|nr:Hypothetical protein, putative [Bodo saltans]|eukprot:CUF64220.1 Hypothetical protein, putative [Bodo saltans]
MDSQRKRTEWSSAHAQLWTTFKRSGSSADIGTTEVTSDNAAVVVSPSAVVGSASPKGSDVLRLERRVLQLEREVEARDAREADTMSLITKMLVRISRNEGTNTKEFRNELEQRISGTSSLAFADAATELITSIEELEGRVGRLASASIEPEEGLPFKKFCEVVGGPIFSARCNTCSDAAVAFTNFMQEIQGAASPSRRQPLASALASAPPSSLAGLLRVSVTVRPTVINTTNSSDATQLDLRRVVDLLGGDSQTCVSLGSSAAELAISKCRDLEECKRDVGTLSIVLAEFERAAHRALRSVGVGVVPTVKSIRAQLSGSNIDAIDGAVPVAKGGEEGAEWIMKRIAHLTKICRDAAVNHGNIETLVIPLRQGPKPSTADTDAKICRRAVDDSVTMVDDTIKGLISSNTRLKESLQRLLLICERFFSRPQAHQIPRVSFAQDTPLSSMLERCQAIAESARLSEQTFFDACEPILAKMCDSHDDSSSATIQEICVHVATAVETLNRAAECSNMTREELARLGEVVSTLSAELDTRWPSIRELLLLDESNELESANPVERLFLRVSSMLLHIPRLKDWIHREKSSSDEIVNDAMRKLSQLIVPLHASDVAVAPPLETLDELVAALHDRFSALQLYQARHHGRVQNARHDHIRLEELVIQKCHRWNQQLKKANNGSIDDESDDIDGVHESMNAESALESIDHAIQSTRSKLVKSLASHKADRVRMENYQASHDVWNRKWQLILIDSNTLAAALGVQTASEASSRSEDPRHILKQCAEFVSTQGCFTEASTSAATIRVLREKMNEALDDKVKMEGAIEHITERLIEIARIMKHSLFNVGCDEEAVDEEIENAKYDNEPLACVLSKLARWVVRLDENINHLVEENKMIVKYFAAIHKHISHEQAEVHDGNLLDMKDTLLLLTQNVLDSVDQLLSAGPSRPRPSDEDPRYRSELLGYDDRLARIHSTICKVNSAMEGIKRVTYLGLQGGLVDDASPTRQGVGFIDADLAAMSNDDLLRIIEKNASFVKTSISAFGSSFKHINILVQKDVDSMQQSLCEIFGTLSEIELEKAFPVDRDIMFNVYRLMNERSTRQKGQYFFQGADEVAPWVSATKILAAMFPSLIDKLHDRIKRLAEVYGTLEKVAVSVYRCRAARGELVATVPAPLKVGTDEAEQPEALTFNVSDEELVEMVEDICRTAADGGVGGSAKSLALEDECVRLQEQLQLLQETVAVTEKKLQSAHSIHAEEKSTVELERDRALSEAAMLRSQLRRAARSQDATRSTPQKYRDPTPTGAKEGIENATPTNKGSPVLKKERTISAQISAVSPAIPLSAVEAYMRNLQKELQSRHLCGTDAAKVFPSTRKRDGVEQHNKQQRVTRVATNSSPSPARNRHPHTMLSSPVRHADSKTGHGDDCDTCKRRARSGSSTRSRSAPRAVVFNIPGVDENDSKNRHSSLAHYTSTTPFNTNTPVPSQPSQKPQHHVVVVTPGKKAGSLATGAGPSPSRSRAEQVLHHKPYASPHRLANLDSDGMQKLVGAVAKR